MRIKEILEHAPGLFNVDDYGMDLAWIDDGDEAIALVPVWNGWRHDGSRTMKKIRCWYVKVNDDGETVPDTSRNPRALVPAKVLSPTTSDRVSERLKLEVEHKAKRARTRRMSKGYANALSIALTDFGIPHHKPWSGADSINIHPEDIEKWADAQGFQDPKEREVRL